jgi:pimeloyl-ACP methyl ester carboxylesterase
MPIDRLGSAGASYEHAILASFDAATADCKTPVSLVGFSLGAMAALRIAAARPDRVGRLVLASPAAPLELGDFLPSMAGGPVFKAAMRGDFVLYALCVAQSLLLHASPAFLFKTMLSGAPQAEQDLMQTPAAATALREGMKLCLGRRHASYRREMAAFVQPWAHLIRDIHCDVQIWQGTRDTWTPPAMAAALAAHLAPHATVTSCEGLGHYSTLAAALKAFRA